LSGVFVPRQRKWHAHHDQDTLPPFGHPAAQRKRVTAGFKGGSIPSTGGMVVLLRTAERRLGLAEALAGCIREWWDPARTVHTLPAMLRFPMFPIACGYEDADDCNDMRGDPLFKLTVGRALESGRDLCSQPTRCRLENAPSRGKMVWRDDLGESPGASSRSPDRTSPATRSTRRVSSAFPS